MADVTPFRASALAPLQAHLMNALYTRERPWRVELEGRECWLDLQEDMDWEPVCALEVECGGQNWAIALGSIDLVGIHPALAEVAAGIVLPESLQLAVLDLLAAPLLESLQSFLDLPIELVRVRTVTTALPEAAGVLPLVLRVPDVPSKNVRATTCFQDVAPEALANTDSQAGAASENPGGQGEGATDAQGVEDEEAFCPAGSETSVVSDECSATASGEVTPAASFDPALVSSDALTEETGTDVPAEDYFQLTDLTTVLDAEGVNLETIRAGEASAGEPFDKAVEPFDKAAEPVCVAEPVEQAEPAERADFVNADDAEESVLSRASEAAETVSEEGEPAARASAALAVDEIQVSEEPVAREEDSGLQTCSAVQSETLVEYPEHRYELPVPIRIFIPDREHVLLVAQRIATLPQRHVPMPEVPVCLVVEAGRMILSVQELAELALDDVLLPESYPAKEGHVFLRFPDRMEGWQCTLAGRDVTVSSFVYAEVPQEEIMVEEQAAPEGQDPAGRAFDTGAIQVSVVFELERRMLQVKDLEALVPGYTFVLGEDALSPVALTVNGKVIGRGRLVDLNGTLGVQLTAVGDPALRAVEQGA